MAPQDLIPRLCYEVCGILRQDDENTHNIIMSVHKFLHIALRLYCIPEPCLRGDLHRAYLYFYWSLLKAMFIYETLNRVIPGEADVNEV